MISLFAKTSPDLWRLTCADFIVRTGYQIGKTPLLPIFAASLGAADILLGTIVAVSTFTGMLLKPVFGFLSDRWGRRFWLYIALFFFIGIPFLYQYVDNPEHLFALRLVHGFATAIFGPVTLAYIIELSKENVATNQAFFSYGRVGGYIIGPILGALFLTWFELTTIFTLIGFMSLLAIIPIFYLTPESTQTISYKVINWSIVKEALQLVTMMPAMWFIGTIEFLGYMATYAVKAFLPVYALSVSSISLWMIGAFFTIQETVDLISRPLSGWLSDRWGPMRVITAGMGALSLSLYLLSMSGNIAFFILSAVIGGFAKGFIFPAALALISTQTTEHHKGTAMGVLGTIRNGGKVAGPVIAGASLYWLSYQQFFTIAAIIMFGLFLLCFFLKYTSLYKIHANYSHLFEKGR